MNIYALESSTGPNDMTKWEGKLPPCGRKGSWGTKKKERFSADLGDLLITHTVFIDAQYSSKAYQTQTVC